MMIKRIFTESCTVLDGRPLWTKVVFLSLALMLWSFPIPLAQAMSPGGVEFVGVVYPLHDLSLSLGVGGVVAEVGVELGQRVSRGDMLIQLDDKPQAIEADRRKVIWKDNSEIRSMRQRHEILAALYQDAHSLYEEVGSISREELSKLKLEYLAAAGRIDQLTVQKERERLEYMAAEEDRCLRRLEAPMDGIVTWFEIDVGEWAEPGKALMRLVNASTSVLRLNVPEHVARGLEMGVELPVRVDGNDGPLNGVHPIHFSHC